MPSILSHAVVGISAAAAAAPAKTSPKLWLLSAAVAMLPDADVLAFRFGVSYSSLFGHRGFFHSIFFSCILGVLAASIFFRQAPVLSQRWFILAAFFSVAASHGLLDALTDGGLGVALFAPFDGHRYFFPWTPIKVSPLGIIGFFSAWGLRVISSEALWIWLPCSAAVFIAKALRHL